jgi:hypothetical protein
VPAIKIASPQKKYAIFWRFLETLFKIVIDDGKDDK